MLIRNVMARDPVSCRADDTLEHATKLMWQNDLGFLPVVDRNGVLAGVITDRDVLLAVYTHGTSLRGLLVEAVMTPSVVTCTIHDEVTEVEHRMAAHQVRRLPVLDDHGTPIGVVSLSDLARASQFGHEVSPKGPTWTLAAITRRRPQPQ